ncbi:MAG: ThuA domain-containing protein [Chitinophagaceae bacterium]
MKRNIQRFALATMAIALLTGLISANKPPKFKVFVTLSKAKDHLKMMAAAKPFLEKIAAQNNFTIDISDDTSKINDANLSKYHVFIQLQQAPFDLSYAQQDAIQKFVEQGKGWVGIHAAGLPGKSFIGPIKSTGNGMKIFSAVSVTHHILLFKRELYR